MSKRLSENGILSGLQYFGGDPRFLWTHLNLGLY